MKPLSNSHKALASLVILGLLAMTATPARAALVKLETGGTITGGDAFLALTGQLWSLVLVYDTEAVTDEFANDPGMGNYHATATTTPIISYKNPIRGIRGAGAIADGCRCERCPPYAAQFPDREDFPFRDAQRASAAGLGREEGIFFFFLLRYRQRVCELVRRAADG